MSNGIKWDHDKPRFDLIPPYIEEEVAKVLTFGAIKYAPDNWKKVPDGKRRYQSALRRHYQAFKKGEQYDPETGLHHMAHLICCAMFLGEADLTNEPLPEALTDDEDQLQSSKFVSSQQNFQPKNN